VNLSVLYAVYWLLGASFLKRSTCSRYSGMQFGEAALTQERILEPFLGNSILWALDGIKAVF